MGSTFRIYEAHPSMYTHTGTELAICLKFDEISGLGPLRSKGIVPAGCTYWGASHGGFIVSGLGYNIFRSQLLTPISSKFMLSDSFFSQTTINFQISFICVYKSTLYQNGL